MFLETIFSFLLASILLTLSPGPDIIYVLVQSISNGKKYGIATSAGLVTGIIAHTLLVALGVSTIITGSPTLFQAIKTLGAAYLFYLAYKVFRSKKETSVLDGAIAPKKTLSKLYREGLIMNLLNPKVTLFFLAFFPGFLWDKTGDTVVQFLFLGAVFMAQAFIIFCSMSVLAGSIATYLNKNKRAADYLRWFQIVVFIAIGIYILFN